MLWQNTTLEFDKFKFEPDNWLCFHCSERCFYLNNPLLWSWFQFLPVLYCTQETKYLLKKNIPTLIFCYCFNVRAGPDLCLTSSIVVHIQEISMALKESVPMLNKGKMRLIKTYVPRLNCMTITHILGFVVFTSFFRDLFLRQRKFGLLCYLQP